MAALLRRYIEAYAPEDRLFSSPSRGERLTQDWVRRRFRKIVDAAGIQQAVTVHTLRHCFATHLIEGGTNLFHVMKLLGHSDIQTTMVYRITSYNVCYTKLLRQLFIPDIKCLSEINTGF